MRRGIVNWLTVALAYCNVQIGHSFGIRTSRLVVEKVQTGQTSRSLVLQSAVADEDQIVSPFDESIDHPEVKPPTKLGDNLDLTWENVEAVLDELRPFLIQDGGNVVVTDIDGPVVKLELQVGRFGCAFSLSLMMCPHSHLLGLSLIGCLWYLPQQHHDNENGFRAWSEGKDSRNSRSYPGMCGSKDEWNRMKRSSTIVQTFLLLIYYLFFERFPGQSQRPQDHRGSNQCCFGRSSTILGCRGWIDRY
jgi:NifU-like domain